MAGQEDAVSEKGPGILRIQAMDSWAMTKLGGPISEADWSIRRECMRRVLRLCGLEAYADGTVQRPQNALEASNWDFNDNYAQMVILNNVSSTEMVHIGNCDSANAMWFILEAMHESDGHLTSIAVARSFFHSKAEEGTDISVHLNKLQSYWECLSQMGFPTDGDDSQNSDTIFKLSITFSLPPSWATFTEPYVSGRKGDPRSSMGSKQFIAVLKQEYFLRKAHAQRAESASQSSRINASASTNLDCTHGGRDCHHPGKNKCDECGKFGHATKDCWGKDDQKRRRTE